jgi:Phospholipase_D-nuclease N-terminal
MERDATDTATDGKSQRKKKRWSDFSPRQQTAIVLGAIAELIVTTIALGDLARRPARQVRGSKLLWLLTFFVQPVGPILYFLVGRRHTTR